MADSLRLIDELRSKCGDLQLCLDESTFRASKLEEEVVAKEGIIHALRKGEQEGVVSKDRMIDELRSRCSVLEKNLESIKAELAESVEESLRDKEAIEQLRRENGSLAVAKDEDANELYKKMAELENERHQLEEITKSQEASADQMKEEIASLAEERDILEADTEELLVQLGLVQQMQGQEREAYVANLNALQGRVHELEGMNEEGEGKDDRIAALLRENAELLKQINDDAERPSPEVVQDLERQVGDLESLSSKQRDELNKIKSSLLEKESVIGELRLENSTARSTDVHNGKKATKELERRLSEKDDEILGLRKEQKLVGAELSKVQAELAQERDRKQKALLEGKNKAEVIFSLQSDLSQNKKEVADLKTSLLKQESQLTLSQKRLLSLQVDLASKENEVHSMHKQLRELEENRQAVGSLSSVLAEKDRLLSDCRTEIDSLKSELEGCRTDLTTAQREAAHLNDRLAEIQKAKREAAVDILGGMSCRTEAESPDVMRDKIVRLASALERSEAQRAESLDRAVRERRSNAESLRKLGESVKRFYSVVSCGDT